MNHEASPGGPFKLARLRAMMFLEYAVRGVWIPLEPRFLSAKVEDGGLGTKS